jgi:predicted nucleic acid-binding protein
MPPNDRLIDTTILVDLLRGQEAAITWVNSVSLQDRWVSVITYFEWLAGCRNRREQRTVAREMCQYRLLHLTEEITHTALAWFGRFHLSHGGRRAGQPHRRYPIHTPSHPGHAEHQALCLVPRSPRRTALLK